MNNESFLQGLLNYLARVKTGTLISIFYLAGILSLAMSTSYSPAMKEPYSSILASLPFLLWGTAGIVMVIRKEAFFLLRFEGMAAIVFGVLMALINVFMAAIFLLVIIKQYLHP